MKNRPFRPPRLRPGRSGPRGGLQTRSSHGQSRRADIERVVVEAGAGDLRCAARPAGRQRRRQGVRLLRPSCWTAASWRSAAKATPCTCAPCCPRFRDGLFGSRYAYIDVTVGVPKTADAQDRRFERRHGSHRRAGRDRSPTARAISAGAHRRRPRRRGQLRRDQDRGVGGGLRLKDSSGDVDVDDVKGDVVVEVDSSGDLDIRRVAAACTCSATARATSRSHDVKRDVIIDDDSSGGIRVRTSAAISPSERWQRRHPLRPRLGAVRLPDRRDRGQWSELGQQAVDHRARLSRGSRRRTG